MTARRTTCGGDCPAVERGHEQAQCALLAAGICRDIDTEEDT